MTMGELKLVAANKVDATILTHASSSSPEDISKMLGGMISPAKVAAHTQTLLKSKDWLTQVQEEQLVLWELRQTLVQLKDKFLDVDNAKLRLAFLKEIAGRLDKRSSANEVDLNTLYANQGRIMGQAYDIALTYIRAAFREEIDPEKWDEVKGEALRHAQRELAKYEAVEA